jgi:hypothetical protein
MSNLHDLSFPAFAEAIRPSGGMNRWPQLGQAKEVVSYTVSMNGDRANQLPESGRDHEYRDVAVHALTEKLGLDPHSFRDNVKVAELLALRHAYLSTVLEASIPNAIHPEIHEEYNRVSDGFTHPWLQEQIYAQQNYEKLLKPALEEAAKAIGPVSAERAAAGVSHGAIVSQNENFTIQSLGNGVVVAHENRRLEHIPHVGEDVTVAYYRGRGQVIANMQDLRIGQPYIDTHTNDLAVNLVDASGAAKHVMMFNSMTMLNEFAAEHELGRGFVIAAMDARESSPKKVPLQPAREPIGTPYLDAKTGSLALDYAENEMRFTAVFAGVIELEKSALGAQLTPQSVEKAKAIDTRILAHAAAASAHVARSLEDVKVVTTGRDVKPADTKSGRYSGAAIADTGVHIVQDRGRNEVTIHDKRILDKLPVVGEVFTAEYKNGRGAVSIRQASKDRQMTR